MSLFKRITWIGATACIMIGSQAYAADIQRFSSVSAMIEDFGDYSTDDESFLVLSEEPLHIRLAKMTPEGDPESVVEAELKRAVMYGVYQTFIHTDVSEVTVTAQPMLTTFNPRSQTLLNKPRYELSVTREQALSAIQAFLDVSNLRELKTQGQYGVSWSEGFNSLYYEDKNPGLKAFYSNLDELTRN